MDLPAAKETVENLRRIAERGLGASVPMGTDAGDSQMVDIFQHTLDELALLKVYLED